LNIYPVKAIYDGYTLKLDTLAFIAEKCEGIITFMKLIAKTKEDILQFFGVWEEESVNTAWLKLRK